MFDIWHPLSEAQVKFCLSARNWTILVKLHSGYNDSPYEMRLLWSFNMSKINHHSRPRDHHHPGYVEHWHCNQQHCVRSSPHTQGEILNSLCSVYADRCNVGRELVAWLLLITEDMRLVTSSVIFSVSHFHLFIRHFSVNSLDLIMGCMLRVI